MPEPTPVEVVRAALSSPTADDPSALAALDSLEAELAAAREALREAHVVIGAAALSYGGFLRITRKAMTEIDLDGELSSWSEPDSIVYTYHALSRHSPAEEPSGA